MLHARSHPRRTLVLLIALLALLIGSPAGARPASAADASIGVDPNRLQINIPLGQSSTRTVTLTNLTGSAISPAIFEAYSDAMPTALTRARASQAPQSV